MYDCACFIVCMYVDVWCEISGHVISRFDIQIKQNKHQVFGSMHLTHLHTLQSNLSCALPVLDRGPWPSVIILTNDRAVDSLSLQRSR